MTPVCELLPWDTEFFGFRIAQVLNGAFSSERAGHALAWCRDQQVRCAYLHIDPADVGAIRAAEHSGFELVDVRITLARCANPPLGHAAESERTVRTACEADLPELRAIASVSHQDTRFYFDCGFSPERCDALYAVWIEKSCRGWADVTFVPEWNGRPAGYLTCHRRDGEAQIGLVAVAAHAQGRHLGAALVEQAVGWAAAQGLPRVQVVTQGRNLAAQRLYQRCGFVTSAMQLTYHRWFD